ncbi:MAG: M28 family metallopeptidase [Oceanicaulis sp.]
MLRFLAFSSAAVLTGALIAACDPPAPEAEGPEDAVSETGSGTADAPDRGEAGMSGVSRSADGIEIAYTVPADEWPHHAETDPEITEEDFAYRIATLADERFGGRGPASEKGEPAADWIATEMERAGLEPAGLDGTWFQPVPLIETTLQEDQSAFEITVNGEPMGLRVGEDVTYWSQNPEQSVSLEDSELVFVGYGIVAPEYGWNDYEGVDVEGKTVVMLINDPGFADPDAGRFNGRAMTYYGRWTYKFEEAARQGAEGAIIVHQTAPASYPWGTVRASWSGPQFILASGADQDYVDVQSWIQETVAYDLFEAAGLSFDELAEQAAAPGFRAVEMNGATLSASLSNELRELSSRNVAGMIEGSERPDEYVLFMAHWDHIGERLNFAGEDQIYNGAVDNATGTTAIIEIAERFASADTRPERSVIFVAVTAEEQGLLGSEFYAQEPLVPLNQTVAGFNFDGMLPIGPTADIVVIGRGSSELEDILEAEANAIGMDVTPDPEPEAGYFYRSDHVTLARRGVPMLYADSGSIHAERGAEYGAQVAAGYRADRYHKPSDEFDGAWDMRGFVQSTRLMYDVAREVTDSEAWPNWYEDNEFRSVRDAMMNDSE